MATLDQDVEFIAVVPARRASTRLPDKPLAEISGKAMVVRVADRASQSGATQVYVATDDAEIADVCTRAGYRAVLTRGDHPSGTDRLAEVAERLSLPDDAIVVNVQGDEPLIPPALIARCARALAEAPDCAIATASHPIAVPGDLFNPNVVKVVTDAKGRALYFSRAPIPWERDAFTAEFIVDRGALASNGVAGVKAQRHVGLYAYRASFLRTFPTLGQSQLERIEALEQLRALWYGYKIVVFETDETRGPGVDTPDDLARVRAIFASAVER